MSVIEQQHQQQQSTQTTPATVLRSQVTEHQKRIFEEHCYALNMKIKSGPYHCECKKYSTNNRQHFYTHRTEHCTVNKCKQKRSAICQICKQTYTLNGLRSHYRNYIEPTRIPRGIHAKFSIRYHMKLLRKMSKKRK